MKSMAMFGVLALVFVGCVSEAGDGLDNENDNDRGTWKLGKADDIATCVDSCGGVGQGGCWCDDACEEWGDCCPDYVSECGGGTEFPTCGLPCQGWRDCLPNEPYCNMETNLCQQDPPQCVTDDDCEGDQGLCHRSGYCTMYPDGNCRPGWVFWEGACDAPGCPDEVPCPVGTLLNTDTCNCDPTDPAPTCTWRGDCTPAYPYCNVETNLCQQDPPQCVTDMDCEGDQGFCHRSGYCSMYPNANCRPGQTFWEGACDTPGCPDEVPCPVDSVLDPDTCLCIPVCG